VSSAGQGQARARSINIETNLLRIWSKDREDTEAKFRRSLGVIVTAIGATVVVCPSLIKSFSDAKAGTDRLQANLAKEQSFVDAQENRLAKATKSLEYANMLAKAQFTSKWVLREIETVSNGAPTGVVFANFKFVVEFGTGVVQLSASADTMESGRRFVYQASRGKNIVKAEQKNLKRVAGGSVHFDYLKRMKAP
jgi:hypothetical protein